MLSISTMHKIVWSNGWLAGEATTCQACVCLQIQSWQLQVPTWSSSWSCMVLASLLSTACPYASASSALRSRTCPGHRWRG